jgi:hypothetical protein
MHRVGRVKELCQSLSSSQLLHIARGSWSWPDTSNRTRWFTRAHDLPSACALAPSLATDANVQMQGVLIRQADQPGRNVRWVAAALSSLC